VANSRVFYCRYEPEIIFATFEDVSLDLGYVAFVTGYSPDMPVGMINPNVFASFDQETYITPHYLLKDFIEIEREDPAVWE
jgi:hypothetical protein